MEVRAPKGQYRGDDRLYPGRSKQELVRRGGPMKRTWTIIGVGDVPGSFKWYQALFGQPATLPAHDYFGQLWANPRFRWNCFALPPRVGRPRASLIDELRSRDTRQRAPVVLPCR